MLGAYLAFGLSRLLGRRFVEVMVPDKHPVVESKKGDDEHRRSKSDGSVYAQYWGVAP